MKILTCLLILGWIHVLPAFGDELDDIQRSREAAQMQYLHEMNTGNYTTQVQKDELQHSLLDPENQKAQDYFKKISETPPPKKMDPSASDLSKIPKADISEFLNAGHGLKPGGSFSGKSGVSVPTSAGVPSGEKAPLRPEFVLDGSNVPKEIEFKMDASRVSTKKISPSPKPSPSRKPSPTAPNAKSS